MVSFIRDMPGCPTILLSCNNDNISIRLSLGMTNLHSSVVSLLNSYQREHKILTSGGSSLNDLEFGFTACLWSNPETNRVQGSASVIPLSFHRSTQELNQIIVLTLSFD